LVESPKKDKNAHLQLILCSDHGLYPGSLAGAEFRREATQSLKAAPHAIHTTTYLCNEGLGFRQRAVCMIETFSYDFIS